MVEIARSQKQVTDADWQRYAKQAVEGMLALEARPRVRRGDPVVIRM